MTSLSAQKTTKINFILNGYPPNTAVKLADCMMDQNYLVDTAQIEANGRLSFTSAQGFKEGMYFLILPNNENVSFFIANGENDFTLETTRGNLIKGMLVKGSNENKLYYENQMYQFELETKYNALTQQLNSLQANTPQYEAVKKQQLALLDERDLLVANYVKDYPTSLFAKFKMGGQNPKTQYFYKPDGKIDSVLTSYVFRQDWWKNVDFSDGRIFRTPMYFSKLKKYILEYTPQNPDSLIPATDFILEKAKANRDLFNMTFGWIASQYRPGQTKLMDGEAVFSHMVLRYFNSGLIDGVTPEDIKTTMAKATEMQASVLGKIGQDVWGKDASGQRRNLYSINSPFKVVYIYMPDCDHCQKETPVLAKFYSEWKNKGVEIFSIAANVDEKRKGEWLAFRQKYGINWANDIMDEGAQSRYHEKYFIDITPELYLLDKNNKILSKNLKPSQLPESIEFHLKNMK
jgi:thiol-disulfide isomerase/thioredoxin